VLFKGASILRYTNIAYLVLSHFSHCATIGHLS